MKTTRPTYSLIIAFIIGVSSLGNACYNKSVPPDQKASTSPTNNLSYTGFPEGSREDVMLRILENKPGYMVPDNFCDDYGIMLQAVQRDKRHIGSASNRLRSDPDFMFEAIKTDCCDALFYASNNLKKNSGFILKSINYISKLDDLQHLVDFMDPVLCQEASFRLDLINKKGCLLQLDSQKLEIFKEDQDVMIAAILHDISNLQYASKALKDDYDFVLKVVKKRGTGLNYVSNTLQENYEIVMAAVKQNGSVLRNVSSKWKEDYNIVMEAIKQNEYALEYASNTLKGNPDIVLEAVKKNGELFCFASEDLKRNQEIAIAAIKQRCYAFFDVPEELKVDKDFLAKAIKANKQVWSLIDKELQKDPDLLTIYNESQ